MVALRNRELRVMNENLLKLKQKTESFATKPAFIFIVCAVAFLFHALAFDLAGLLLFAFVGGLMLVLLDDARPALTVIFFTIFIVSTQNSTGFTKWGTGVGYYERKSVLIPLIIGGCFLVGCMAVRCVKFRRNFASAKLWLPLVVFSVSLVLSGVSSAAKYYYGESVLFGLIGVASYLGFYLILTGITDGFDGLFDYAATLFSGVTLIISLEVIYVYFLHMLPPFEFLPENWRFCMRAGKFPTLLADWKNLLITGCGVSNQSGAMLACLLPAVFCKIAKSKNYVWYSLLAILSATTIVLTLSRAAMLVGGVLFVVLAVVTAAKIEKKEIFVGIFAAFALAGIIALMILADKYDVNLLKYLSPKKGPGLNGRGQLWKAAVDYFKESPIFGVGFAYPYHNDPTSADAFRALLHNFVFQAFASSGIAGVIALAYALIAVFFRLIKNSYEGKLYILCFLFGFMVISLLDIMYYVPYYVLFAMFMIVVAEKDILKRKEGQKTLKSIEKDGCYEQ